MFTGIVEDIGCIKKIQRNSLQSSLTIESKKITEDIAIGDSISVNGICLTVTLFNHSTFTVDVMNETWNRTSLSTLTYGGYVNLERALPTNGKLGGHIVTGHIDGTGRVVSIRKDDNATWYKIQAPSDILDFIVEKGSITIDGISLTIASVSSNDFSVSIIPHTIKSTTLQSKTINDRVNLETDIIGKYIRKFMNEKNNSPVSQHYLIQHEF